MLTPTKNMLERSKLYCSLNNYEIRTISKKEQKIYDFLF